MHKKAQFLKLKLFKDYCPPSSEEEKLMKNIKGQHIQYIQRQRAKW